jgi:hypothetical protein
MLIADGTPTGFPQNSPEDLRQNIVIQRKSRQKNNISYNKKVLSYANRVLREYLYGIGRH